MEQHINHDIHNAACGKDMVIEDCSYNSGSSDCLHCHHPRRYWPSISRLIAILRDQSWGLASYENLLRTWVRAKLIVRNMCHLLTVSRLAGGFCVLTYYRAPMDILPRIILTTPWMLSYLFLALRPEPRRWIVVLFWASCVVWNFICYLGGAWVQTSSMASICLALIIASLRGSITERENMIAQRREQSQRFRKWRKRLAKKAEHET